MPLSSRAACCFVLAFAIAQAQPEWTPPLTITRDTINEQYASVPDFTFNYFAGHPAEDLLAFVRNGRQICVKRTEASGTRWSDSMYCVPNDSSQFSHPTLAHVRVPGTSRHMLVLVWVANEYPLPGSNLMYTTWRDGVWN